MRPLPFGFAPFVRKAHSLRGQTRRATAFFHVDSTIHYLILSSSSGTVGEVPELTVLYTRPYGVPNVEREILHSHGGSGPRDTVR